MCKHCCHRLAPSCPPCICTPRRMCCLQQKWSLQDTMSTPRPLRIPCMFQRCRPRRMLLVWSASSPVCRCNRLLSRYQQVRWYMAGILHTLSHQLHPQVLWALVHGRVCMLHRCVFTPTYTSVTHSLQVVTYVYMCICVYMHVYAHGCVRASMILLDTLKRCY